MAETEALKSVSTQVAEREKVPSSSRQRKLIWNLYKIAAPVLLTAVAWGCGVGVEDKEASGPPTITPAAAGTIEAHPTIKATVVPAQTPPEVTPTPTPRSATPNREIVTAPEKPTSNWVIEVDPKIVGQASTYRTIEEDKAIIKTAIEKFPQIGKLKIVLTSGSPSVTVLYSAINPENPSITYLGRDLFQPLLERTLWDELGSFFDVQLNEKTLKPYYLEADWQKLRSLREAIIAKYRNFPKIEKILSPQKLTNPAFVEATNYADALFIAQAKPLYYEGKTEGYPLQEPLFASFLASPLLGKFAGEVKGQINFNANFGEFARNHQARLAQLAQSSPFWRLALEILKSKEEYLANFKAVSAFSPLSTKYLDDYFEKALPVFANLALTQALGEGDQRLLALIGPDKLPEIKNKYDYLYQEVSGQLFASAYSGYLAGLIGQDEDIANYHRIINTARP